MENFIIKLYKKYLYDHISHDEFMEMRHAINNTNDNELSELLEEEWAENIFPGELQKQSKQNIRAKLDFYIENDKKRIDKKRMLQIAAVVIPFFVLSTFFITKQLSVDNPNNFAVSVERGNKALVTLPDQSKVWMNANSTLEYKKGEGNTREVKLTGEAFFKVFKDKDQPFIVTMNNLQVEVLGTSFNAKSRPGSDIIETSLVEGSIKLRSPDLSQDYYLKPNEKAMYSQSTGQLQIMDTDNDIETAWKDNKLKFSSKRFIDVMSMIEDWYDVEIICKCPEIENDLISGTFKNEKLETTLEALKMQYKIHFIKSRDTIIVVSNN